MTEQHYYLDILRRLVPKSIPQHVDMSQLWRVEICAHLALIVLFVMVGWVVVYFEIIDLNNGPGGFLAFLRQLTTDFTQLADMMVVLFWCEVVVQSYVFSYLKYLDGALALWKIIGISAFPLCAALILIAIGASMREGFWIVALGVVCLCLFGMTFLGPLIMHSLYQLIPNKEDISGP